MDQSTALLHALRITETDLEANRDGRLGANQRRRTLRNLAIGTAVGLGFSAWIIVAALNESRTPGVETQNWIIPAVIGLVVAALTVVAVWTTLRGMRRRIECLTGSLSLGLVRAGRGGSVAKVLVGGRSFTLPRPPHASAGVIPAYRAILTGGSYHVYVQGMRLVAMEPVSESLLDRASEGVQGSVPVVGSANSNRQPRVTLFAKVCIVFLLLAVLGMGIAGAYLMVVQFTGTAARASVTECVEDTDAQYPSVTYDCTGTWVTGGDLVGGNGHVVVGTVDGVDPTDVGKTIDVRVAGGEAYAESLVLPLLLMGLGFPAAALIAFLLFRVQRGQRVRRTSQ